MVKGMKAVLEGQVLRVGVVVERLIVGLMGLVIPQALAAQDYPQVLPGHPLKERVVAAGDAIWMLAAEPLVALVVVALVVISAQVLQQEMGLLELLTQVEVEVEAVVKVV
jgi:hypothetical protein